MKRLLETLAALAFAGVVLFTIAGSAGDGFPLAPDMAKAGGMQLIPGKEDLQLGTKPPLTLETIPVFEMEPFKPVITDGGSDGTYWGPEFEEPTNEPIPDGQTWDTVTRRPDDGLEEETTQRITDPPAVTQPPETHRGGGKYLTGEGPLFLSFRRDLTDNPLMFTPMDLSLDGEYRFPLIGSTMQVVGEAKAEVRSGMATITYSLFGGVQINREKEFFTFFPDIRSVKTIVPEKLQDVKMAFGIPYSVASWLGSDQKVLLYINCPVSYDAGQAGLQPFSLQDQGYLAHLSALLPLMD